MDMAFDYDSAFSSNIGWVTETAQQFLRSLRIAMKSWGAGPLSFFRDRCYRRSIPPYSATRTANLL